MVDIIYSLTIITGVDDYKSRGESPTSYVTLYKTHDDAFEYFRQFLKYKIMREDGYDNEYELKYIEKSGFKHLFTFIESDEMYKFNENLEIPFDEMFEFYEYFFKGEFIPYKWTYEIKKHNNPHNKQ